MGAGLDLHGHHGGGCRDHVHHLVKAKKGCSFLKKRTKRLLFLRSFHDRGHGRSVAASARIKSLFASFSSEKEDLP
jgi:hypothetical protein